MLRLVLNAIRARRAQSFAVLVLCALAVAAAAAAPLYVLTASRISIQDQLRAAPAGERILSIGQTTSVTRSVQNVMDSLDTSASKALPGTFRAPVNGVASIISVSYGSQVLPGRIAYRDGMCAHVVITGACPSGPDELMLTANTADTLGVRVGSTINALGNYGKLGLTVTGVYRQIDPTGAYWSTPLLTSVSIGITTALPDTVFASRETLAEKQFPQLTAVADVYLPDSVFTTDANLTAELSSAQKRLDAQQIKISAGTIALAKDVAKNRHIVQTGVFVPLAELLGMCWFALFLAARYTAEQRRSDTGLLKLRGSTRWTLFRLSVGQGVASLVGGVVVGLAALWAAVRFWPALAAPTTAGLRLSAAAVAITVAGAVVAIVTADWRTSRILVTDLLRKVPPRRRGVRTDVADLVIVVLAAACAYQAWVDSQVSFMTTLAPSLVALSLTLIVARGLLPICMRVGASALRGARLGAALGTLQVARRPGADRVFVLLAVSAALLSTSILGWNAAVTSSRDRAVIDIGAARVLTVNAANPQQLLGVVRAADPNGTEAMAAVEYQSTVAADAIEQTSVAGPILAVDTSRFAAVAAWSSAYGSASAARISAALRTSTAQPIVMSGPTLSIDATAVEQRDPIFPTHPLVPLYVVVHLVNALTGGTVATVVGPYTNGRHTVTAAVDGCTTAPCWIASLEVIAPPASDGTYQCAPTRPCPVFGSQLAIHSIQTPGHPVADAAALGDVTRWRGELPDGVAGLNIDHANGVLTLTIGDVPKGTSPGFNAYTAWGPVPLPAVQAGPSRTDLNITRNRVNVFDGAPVPLRIMDAFPLLPVIGGQGLIVDLTSLERVTADAGPGVSQVWLAPGAPASIVDKLTAGGLNVLSDDSITSDQRRLSRQGPAAALTFQLLVGVVGVLLAVTALAAAASAERPARAGELAVLRTQGLPGRVATAVGYGGYGVLAAIAALFGVLAAVASRLIVRSRAPVFIDSWSLVPVQRGISTVPILVSAVAVVIVFGVAAVAVGRSLTNDARRRSAA